MPCSRSTFIPKVNQMQVKSKREEIAAMHSLRATRAVECLFLMMIANPDSESMDDSTVTVAVGHS